MLLGKSRLVTALQRSAKASPADETLIAAERSSRTTLRFSEGRIHQNFHEEEVTVWVKVAAHGRMGIATTGSLNHEAVMKAIESAMTVAKIHAKQAAPAFSTAPSDRPTPKLTTYFSSTLERPLSDSIETIRALWTRSAKRGMMLAGSFVVGEDELAVAGNRGLSQYQPFSIAGLRLVAAKNSGSGFAAQTVRDIETLDPQALAERAWKFCALNQNAVSIPVGQYDVLLEPEAVSELLEWLTYIGFGAKQVVEGTSFLSGRMGERLMSPQLSIADDGADPGGLMAPFDYEGVPKQKVVLIGKGEARGFVYDSHYARMHHKQTTGHALSYDENEGPLAMNLLIAPGTTPHEEMLKKMSRGLWISRFHYVNGLLKTQEALMTGLTRDGTFLIKNGKVTGAVKNLRFMQSILEAFSKVLNVSRERRLIADPSQGMSSQVVPALLIKDFTFTGQTQ